MLNFPISIIVSTDLCNILFEFPKNEGNIWKNGVCGNNVKIFNPLPVQRARCRRPASTIYILPLSLARETISDLTAQDVAHDQIEGVFYPSESRTISNTILVFSCDGTPAAMLLNKNRCISIIARALFESALFAAT